MEKPKLLVTGAGGFLGSRIKTRLGHDFNLKMLTRHDCDITNKDDVLSCVCKAKPDYILHGAALAATDFCNDNPQIAHEVNVNGALNMAQAAQKQGAKFIFLSTEQVFNGNKEIGPYDEETIAMPNTVYGQNKLEAEEKLKDLLNGELLIFRLTWLFGMAEYKSPTNPNIITNILNGIMHHKKWAEKHNEFRGMTYVHELIDHMQALINLPYGIYHVGSCNELSRYEISQFILKALGKDSQAYLEKDYHKERRDIRINTKKLQKHNIYFSSTQEGIMQCLTDFKLI